MYELPSSPFFPNILLIQEVGYNCFVKFSSAPIMDNHSISHIHAPSLRFFGTWALSTQNTAYILLPNSSVASFDVYVVFLFPARYMVVLSRKPLYQ